MAVENLVQRRARTQRSAGLARIQLIVASEVHGFALAQLQLLNDLRAIRLQGGCKLSEIRVNCCLYKRVKDAH